MRREGACGCAALRAATREEALLASSMTPSCCLICNRFEANCGAVEARPRPRFPHPPLSSSVKVQQERISCNRLVGRAWSTDSSASSCMRACGGRGARVVRATDACQHVHEVHGCSQRRISSPYTYEDLMGTHTQTKGHKHSHAVMKTLLGQNRKVSQRAKEDTGAAESESPGSLR